MFNLRERLYVLSKPSPSLQLALDWARQLFDGFCNGRSHWTETSDKYDFEHVERAVFITLAWTPVYYE